MLAKLLLFERLGNPNAYAELIAKVSDNGKPTFLADWEERAVVGRDLDAPAPWDEPFVNEWLALPLALADTDLRGVLYVSREHAPPLSN